MSQQSRGSLANPKISPAFIKFLIILLVPSLFVFIYIFIKAGENPSSIVLIVLAVLGCISLFVVGAKKIVKRSSGFSSLPACEQKYAQDIMKYRIFLNLFKDLADGQLQAASLIVTIGYMLKWLLFWIFSGGFFMVIVRNDTFLSKTVFISLAVVWCPWIENVIMRRFNYKIVFFLKVLLTILVACMVTVYDS